MADRYVAKETVHTEDADGTPRIVLAGQEVAVGDWILDGREALFESVDEPAKPVAKKTTGRRA